MLVIALAIETWSAAWERFSSAATTSSDAAARLREARGHPLVDRHDGDVLSLEPLLEPDEEARRAVRSARDSRRVDERRRARSGVGVLGSGDERVGPASAATSSACAARTRRASRWTFSTSAIRSMMGTAQISPMLSGEISWYASTKASRQVLLEARVGVLDEQHGQFVDAREPVVRARRRGAAAPCRTRPAGSLRTSRTCSSTRYELSSSHSVAGETAFFARTSAASAATAARKRLSARSSSRSRGVERALGPNATFCADGQGARGFLQTLQRQELAPQRRVDLRVGHERARDDHASRDGFLWTGRRHGGSSWAMLQAAPSPSGGGVTVVLSRRPPPASARRHGSCGKGAGGTARAIPRVV